VRFWPRNWSRNSWIELMTFMIGRFSSRGVGLHCAQKRCIFVLKRRFR
jgi:hypothetical protein